MTTEKHKMADRLLLREGGGLLTPDVIANDDVGRGNSRTVKGANIPPSLTHRVTALTESHILKLWGKIVEARLRVEVSICEQKYGTKMPRLS